MLWIILLFVSFVITFITFFICGTGGLFLLLALNGFSESQAMPFLVLYALFSLGVDVVLSAAANWLIVKKRHPDSGVKFWMVAGVSMIIPVLTLGVIVVIMTLKNLVF